MVALDCSESACEAFSTALNLMDKRRDELFLISAIQQINVIPIGDSKYSKQIEEEHKKNLLKYVHRCEEQGVRYYKPILARGKNVGEMLCMAAEQKYVDFLVLGRRGMNRFSRIVTGSTSKYCMEHAPCNIIVTKGCFMPEEHGSRYEVQLLEEKERKRRLKEMGKAEKHYASKEEVRHLEEHERQRRLREREEEDLRIRKAEQEASMIKHLRELEEERLRRGVGSQQYSGRLGERIERLQMNE
jgi:nucleotide-binding universal stress UspA family protein